MTFIFLVGGGGGGGFLGGGGRLCLGDRLFGKIGELFGV